MNTKTRIEEATTSPKVAFTAFQEGQEMLEKRIAEMQRQMEDGKQQFIETIVSQGWKKFDRFSSYYGSHSELGEGDRNDLFLFHPSVDITGWNGVSFSHGHNGQNENNDAFDAWLSSLTEDQYMEL